MKICVIHPKSLNKSAKWLAETLGAVTCNPWEKDVHNFKQFDVVFNYGCNRSFLANNVINKTNAVATCISKLKTLYKLAKLQIPTIPFTEDIKEIPDSWKEIVCRETDKGAKGDGFSVVKRGKLLPPAAFYSEYYKHKWEFRVMIFNGKVVVRYVKREDKEGNWEFDSVDKAGFEAMDAACLAAAKVIGIDFVGMDILANSPTEFKILEANSGPVMTEDVLSVLTQYFADKGNVHV